MAQYGYFSKKALKSVGTVFWSTPDHKVVECTSVGSSADGAEYYFDDKILLGEVVRFVRLGQKPSAHDKMMSKREPKDY